MRSLAEVGQWVDESRAAGDRRQVLILGRVETDRPGSRPVRLHPGASVRQDVCIESESGRLSDDIRLETQCREPLNSISQSVGSALAEQVPSCAEDDDLDIEALDDVENAPIELA